jgi:hypothetical protein
LALALTIMLATTCLAQLPTVQSLRAGDSPEEAKSKATIIDIVREFIARHGYDAYMGEYLTVTRDKELERSKVTFYRVTQGGIEEQGGGQFIAHGIRDGSEWLVAVSNSGRFFKLQGFDETDFYSLALYLRSKVDSPSQAVAQAKLYFKLAYDLPVIFVNDTASLVQAVQDRFGGKDAASMTDEWISRVPEEIKQALSPPAPRNEGSGFTIEFYGIEAPLYQQRLSLVKYTLFVAFDGNVIIRNRDELYWADPELRVRRKGDAPRQPVVPNDLSRENFPLFLIAPASGERILKDSTRIID